MIAICTQQFKCDNFIVNKDDYIFIPEYYKTIKTEKYFSCKYIGPDSEAKPTTQFDITQNTFKEFFEETEI